MPITPEEYKESLRLFPAGVTIVTIRSGAKTHGLTVSAFAARAGKWIAIRRMKVQKRRVFVAFISRITLSPRLGTTSRSTC